MAYLFKIPPTSAAAESLAQGHQTQLVVGGQTLTQKLRDTLATDALSCEQLRASAIKSESTACYN